MDKAESSAATSAPTTRVLPPPLTWVAVSLPTDGRKLKKRYPSNLQGTSKSGLMDKI